LGCALNLVHGILIPSVGAAVRTSQPEVSSLLDR
jgi:hypothetical protein